MAEVLIAGGGEGLEGVEDALKRLKRVLNKEGTLRDYRHRVCDGFLTPGQRRRGKKQRARLRALKTRLKKIGQHHEHAAGRDEDGPKELAQNSPLYNDAIWATGEETWDPDLTPVKFPKPLAVGERRFWPPPQKRDVVSAVLGFAQSQRLPEKKEEPEAPSTHACVIAVIERQGKILFPIVRSLNDDGTERENFQFPGGGAEKGESAEETAQREYEEETGLTLRLSPFWPNGNSKIDIQSYGLHTFVCFFGKASGQRTRKGAEIIELKLVTLTQLSQMAEEGMLSFKHRRAFEHFRIAIKAVQKKQAEEVTSV